MGLVQFPPHADLLCTLTCKQHRHLGATQRTDGCSLDARGTFAAGGGGQTFGKLRDILADDREPMIEVGAACVGGVGHVGSLPISVLDKVHCKSLCLLIECRLGARRKLEKL